MTPIEPCHVVWLRGEHDEFTVPALSEALAQVIALDDADVVVDLSDVQFMGAGTVGVFRRAQVLLGARSRSLVLRSPSWCAWRVLGLCDWADLPDPEPRHVRSVPGSADALGSWVPVPATESDPTAPMPIIAGGVTVTLTTPLPTDVGIERRLATVADRGGR